MLIRDAEIRPGVRADLRLVGAKIAAMEARLTPLADEAVIDAHGRALSVGLHDHHLHLMAFAAALDSIPCGPPCVDGREALARTLREAAARQPPGDAQWLRGIGFHESVAGDIDRDWLDRIAPAVPVRIQHRSGRLWLFNACGLRKLGVHDDAGTHDDLPLERVDGRLTGRLYDGDSWLRARLHGDLPALARASAALARYGVTGITDAGVHNGRQEFAHFVAERERAHLLQNVLMMGGAELDTLADTAGVRRGPTKLYLRDAHLPTFDAFCDAIRRSRRARRAVAIHCVTVTELIFASAALQHCGPYAGDRIEHAAVAPPEALLLLAEQSLTVVTQPNFVFERGDAYRKDVAPPDQPWLYRARGFVDAGVALAGSTDAPYGDANPWLAMAAAVHRRTRGGKILGADEALPPPRAVALFTGDARRPGAHPRTITPGATADLCLLDRPWVHAHQDLAAVQVDLTIKGGAVIWER